MVWAALLVGQSTCSRQSSRADETLLSRRSRAEETLLSRHSRAYKEFLPPVVRPQQEQVEIKFKQVSFSDGFYIFGRISPAIYIIPRWWSRLVNQYLYHARVTDLCPGILLHIRRRGPGSRSATARTTGTRTSSSAPYPFQLLSTRTQVQLAVS